MPLFSKLTDKLGDMMKEKLGGRDNEHESSAISHAEQEAHHEQQQHHESQPSLPLGWIQQWDPASQRYYYVEQATGRTQWEPPVTYPSGGIPNQHYAHDQPSHGEDMHHGAHSEQKSSNSGIAFVGGAALGAVGGAWAAHEYGEHEEEEAAAAAASSQPNAAAPVDATTAVPVEGESSDVESEQESVQEAADEVSSEREDVEEAQEEVAEASSESDREEAMEELEEEQEELEETQEEHEEEQEDLEEEIEDEE